VSKSPISQATALEQAKRHAQGLSGQGVKKVMRYMEANNPKKGSSIILPALTIWGYVITYKKSR
jgi:hypothetical protein